ncbi:MAG TPA: DinB family protein [Vicinamibacterales bacterium]|nr:DinB family protein [Vicinamibacterales bacterium]
MPKNPYADDLGPRNPLEVLAETPQTIRALVEKWPAERWERSYAPGKWSARRVIIHLAQTELALSVRVRFAASQDSYVAQPFNQDDWIGLDDNADAATALDAYTAVRRLDVAMFKAMNPAQQQRTFKHPEYGDLTPEWVAAQLAGHDIHHFKQLQQIK